MPTTRTNEAEAQPTIDAECAMQNANNALRAHWTARAFPDFAKMYTGVRAVKLPPRVLAILSIFGGLILLTAIECRLLGEMYPLNQWILAKTSFGGTANQFFRHGWLPDRIFDSRILYLPIVYAIARLIGDTNAAGTDCTQAYIYFMYVSIFLSNTLLYSFGAKSGVPRERIWIILSLYASLTPILCDKSDNWGWDYVDMITMPIFAILVFTRGRSYHFLLLFLFQITNRESALFIPLFMAMRSIQRRCIDWRQASLAAGMFVSGAWLINLMRSSYASPIIYRDEIRGQTWMWPHNRALYIDHWPYPDSVVPLLLFTAILVVLRVSWRKISDPLPSLMLVLALFISNMMFGLALELRIWLILVPFLVVPLLTCSTDRSVTLQRSVPPPERQ